MVFVEAYIYVTTFKDLSGCFLLFEQDSNGFTQLFWKNEKILNVLFLMSVVMFTK